jgi:hypothetical protein
VSVRKGEDGVRILYVLQMVLEDNCRVHNRKIRSIGRRKIHK